MSAYEAKVMLVTGGAGFIGGNFIRHLLSQNTSRHLKIINLDLLTYAGKLDHLKALPHAEQHEFVQGDITDRALVEQLVRTHQVDTIVHFAAESHVDRSIADPAAFIKTNVMGTWTLLDVARHYWLSERHWHAGQCRFHHISTDEVYGSLQEGDDPFTETSLYAPNSPYSASKASADHLVRAYYHTYHLPVTTTNCSNNYGPYQHDEKFIPTIIRACLNWKRIPIYGDGSQIRDWLYVDDHCRAISAVLERGRLGETYNVGGWNEWENIAIVKYICHLMDEYLPRETPYKGLIAFVNDRPGHDWRYAIDANKIKSELNWVPNESFESGIRKTVEFYLSTTTA